MKTLPGVVIAGLLLHAALLVPHAKGADAPAPSRYEQAKSRTATIYEANSGQKRVLYKFKRSTTQSGSTLKVVREFNYPDGKIAARESMEYEGDQLVSYDLEELQINAHGTAKLQRVSKALPKGQIAFAYITTTGSSTKTNADTEPLVHDTLVGDMIGPFLVAHWDDLIKGKTVKCRYIAASRAETVGFEFEKQSETTRQGKPVVIIKMSPSSLIISALVDPLYFTMEKDGEHRCLQYDGRTTPKIRDGNKWKDLDAETVFDWE